MKNAKKIDPFDEYDPACSSQIHDSQVHASIYTIFETVQDHFQETDFPIECVTINSKSHSRTPVSLNLEFLNEKGDWKINLIHNANHDSGKETHLKA